MYWPTRSGGAMSETMAIDGGETISSPTVSVAMIRSNCE